MAIKPTEPRQGWRDPNIQIALAAMLLGSLGLAICFNNLQSGWDVDEVFLLTSVAYVLAGVVSIFLSGYQASHRYGGEGNSIGAFQFVLLIAVIAGAVIALSVLVLILLVLWVLLSGDFTFKL